MERLLDETLFGQKAAISASILSRKAGVPVSQARESMQSFLKSSKTPISASFVVSGLQSDRVGHNAPVFRIVAESQVEEAKSDLKSSKVEIYTLSPNNATDAALLTSLGHQLREMDMRATLDELNGVQFLINPLVTSLNVKKEPAVPEIKAQPAKKVEVKAEPKTEPKVEAKPVPKPKTEVKPAPKPKAKAEPKSKSPFARITKEEAVAKAFDRRQNQTAAVEKVVVADAVDNDVEEEEDAMDVVEDEQRKKLETLFDEEDAMEIDESEEEPEEPEPEPEIEAEPEITPESEPPVAKEPSPEDRRGRKKVTRRRHFEDEEGNLVTTTEEVWVSCDEEEAPKPAPKPVSKALPKIPRRNPQPGQQATLMNFFAKKP